MEEGHRATVCCFGENPVEPTLVCIGMSTKSLGKTVQYMLEWRSHDSLY